MHSDPELFARTDWIDNHQRCNIMNNLSNLSAKYPHNATLTPHVIPVLQGLSKPDLCWDLCKHGFSQISQFDEGYYGKGMYFTSSLEYAVNIFANLENRVILVSFVNIGNPYPCIENPSKPRESLIGRNIKQGYDCHYSVVDGNGLPLTNEELMNAQNANRACYDELVVPEEQQILPCYLVFLGRGKRATISRAKVEYNDDEKRELENARQEDYREEEIRTKSFQIEKDSRPTGSILKPNTNYYNSNFAKKATPTPPPRKQNLISSTSSTGSSNNNGGRGLPKPPMKKSGPPPPVNLTLNNNSMSLNYDEDSNGGSSYQLDEQNY